MLEYLKYSERGYFMKNNVKEIMKEYKEGIEKIDNAYKVKKVDPRYRSKRVPIAWHSI